MPAKEIRLAETPYIYYGQRHRVVDGARRSRHCGRNRTGRKISIFKTMTSARVRPERLADGIRQFVCDAAALLAKKKKKKRTFFFVKIEWRALIQHFRTGIVSFLCKLEQKSRARELYLRSFLWVVYIRVSDPADDIIRLAADPILNLVFSSLLRVFFLPLSLLRCIYTKIYVFISVSPSADF